MRGETATIVPWASSRDRLDYGAVFEALGSPLALLLVEGDEVRFVDVNATFSRMIRQSPEAAVERRFESVLPLSAGGALIDGAVRAASSLESIRVEADLSATGRDPQAVIITPLQETARGRLILIEAEQRTGAGAPGKRGHTLAFDRLADVNEGLIYIYDLREARSLYTARPLAEMLGRDPGDAIRAQDFRDLVHPDDREALEAHLTALRVMDDWGVEIASFRLPSGDGWRWLEVRTRVLARDRGGQVRRILGVATDVTDRRSMAEALDAAGRALLDAAESERRRVGRELHDSTSQHLVAIDLGLGALQRRLGGAADVEAKLFTDLRASLNAAQREIRAFSYLLHPPLLKRRGLLDTMRRFVEGFARRTVMDIDLRLPNRLPALPEGVEMVLFRITQEALMNVFRHADARHVRIELILRKDAAVIEIEDDGVGIEDAVPGVGITGMRARLAQLNGRLTVTPLLVGTKVRAFIPLGQRPKRGSQTLSR